MTQTANYQVNKSLYYNFRIFDKDYFVNWK